MHYLDETNHTRLLYSNELVLCEYDINRHGNNTVVYIANQ